MTVAVIDLGTNTFHLLVARMKGNQLEVVLRERRFVKLGVDGVGSFSFETLSRARNCLEFFRDKIRSFEDLSIRIMGTAALRKSSNSQAISKMVLKLFDTKLEVIDGQREAELIYKGVCFDGYPNEKKNLIVDIGGGSVEFIIFKKDAILFQKSFNIGIGWMYHRFKHSDPILEKEIKTLENHLAAELPPLQEALDEHQPELLIGASGTFDLLFNQLIAEEAREFFSRSELLKILDSNIFTTLQERENDPKIPASRVDYVPLAFTILKYFLKMENAPKQIGYSPYALKEGVLSEMLFV